MTHLTKLFVCVCLAAMVNQASGAIIDCTNLSVTKAPQEAGSGFNVANIVNSSGLTSYAFDATHSVGDLYGTGHGSMPGSIFFDLGQVWTIDEVAFWNPVWSTLATKEFQFGWSSSNSIDFGDYMVLVDTSDVGTPSLLAYSGAVPSQIYTFTPTTARYVALNVTGIQSAGDQFTLGEIAFNAYEGTVPEPTTLAALSGLLGMGLIGRWWRRRKAP